MAATVILLALGSGGPCLPWVELPHFGSQSLHHWEAQGLTRKSPPHSSLRCSAHHMGTELGFGGRAAGLARFY